ncbi:MAG: hypothetical protein R3D84_11685 [Paracoccaceae bacterium]
MILSIERNEARAPEAVEQLLARYGLRAVLAALVAHYLGRRSRRARIGPEALSAHLRRDIGLAPEASRRNYWDYL